MLQAKQTRTMNYGKMNTKFNKPMGFGSSNFWELSMMVTMETQKHNRELGNCSRYPSWRTWKIKRGGRWPSEHGQSLVPCFVAYYSRTFSQLHSSSPLTPGGEDWHLLCRWNFGSEPWFCWYNIMNGPTRIDLNLWQFYFIYYIFPHDMPTKVHKGAFHSLASLCRMDPL